MEFAKRAEAEWRKEFEKMRQGDFFRLLAEGRMDKGHYLRFLRETYFNVYLNPKLMALFLAHLRSDRSDLEAKFLKHAAMEIGHDALALEDYRIMGGDPEEVRKSLPLPTTEALSAFIVFQIQHRNPIAYLGYLYHLEALPVHSGTQGIESLLRLGVPAEATSFLREHAEADPVHVKWNKEYLDGFIRNEADFQAMLYGLRGTCRLHAGMLQGILEAGEDWSPSIAHEKAHAKAPAKV
jgi:pyrroloquinoline quinone (PQQ) biosynthesis protein C